MINMALRRARAAVDILNYMSLIEPSSNRLTYVKTDDVKLTCCIWRPTSKPKQDMITAAMLIPPAPVCTPWNISWHTVAMSVAYQGTRRSTRRPIKGPTATPNMPTRPKRPIASLKRHIDLYMYLEYVIGRTWNSGKAVHQAEMLRSPWVKRISIMI
jgi:hypothetical protein